MNDNDLFFDRPYQAEKLMESLSQDAKSIYDDVNMRPTNEMSFASFRIDLNLGVVRESTVGNTYPNLEKRDDDYFDIKEDTLGPVSLGNFPKDFDPNASFELEDEGVFEIPKGHHEEAEI